MSFVIPAIDLIDNRCVRLTQGAYDDCKFYPESPLEMARKFSDAGCTRLHLVDLLGARQGKPKHLEVLEEIASQTELSIDFSGGLRSKEDIERVLSAGASQAAIGSAAAKQPERFAEWVSEFGADSIILSADARDEKIAVYGWEEQTEVSLISFIEGWQEKVGIRTVAVTDISRDGKLTGPNFDLYTKLKGRFPSLEIIASGGVSSAADISRLQEISLHGAIVGKALYEGKIELKDLRIF